MLACKNLFVFINMLWLHLYSNRQAIVRENKNTQEIFNICVYIVDSYKLNITIIHTKMSNNNNNEKRTMT